MSCLVEEATVSRGMAGRDSPLQAKGLTVAGTPPVGITGWHARRWVPLRPVWPGFGGPLAIGGRGEEQQEFLSSSKSVKSLSISLCVLPATRNSGTPKSTR